MTTVRMPVEITMALEAARLQERDPPSRSELIRRIVVEWLTGRGFLK